MIINYTARINQFDSLLSKSKNSLSSVFRKILLTLIIMVGLISTSSQTFGQISYTNGFNGTALGWGTNGFGFTTVATCEGSDALRANQYSAGTAYRFMESPALGSSAGDDVEIKFDYKVINWSGGGATAANFGSIYLEYSINGGISWDTLSTINSSNHIPSISCATITDTIPSNLIPSGSNFKVRYAGSYNAGDYYLYFDAFSAIELTNCLLNPVNITGLCNG